MIACCWADFHRKRHREDDRHGPEISKRNSNYDSRRGSDHNSRPVHFSVFSIHEQTLFSLHFALQYISDFDNLLQEKNPRFRESGDSDEEEDEDRKRRPWLSCVSPIEKI